MKKSRKRLLISSVAMLLVAMLALGTATFAWFTQSTTATANGVKVTASKASTLEISKSDHAWGTTINYGVNSNLIPASSADGASWFTANALDANGAVDSGASAVGDTPARASSIKAITPVYAQTTPQYVFFDQLNVRNGGVSGSINNITITVTFTGDASDYVRFALVPCAAGAANTQVANNEDAFATHVYGKTADTTGSETKALTTTAGATGNVQTKVWTAIADFPTTLAAGDASYFNFYVWFEGQDSDCKDANLGQTLDGLTFTVNGTPA